MKAKKSKLIVLLVIALLVAAFFIFDLGRFLTLDYLKSQQRAFDLFYAEHGLLTIGIYFFLYVAVTALSLPGAAIMTLAGGALFGFWTALIVVSFASSIGATLAFLVSRFLLRDWVQNKFGDKLKTINAGGRKRRCFLSFFSSPGASFPLLCHQPGNGSYPIARRPLLSGQSDRHAAGDCRLC